MLPLKQVSIKIINKVDLLSNLTDALRNITSQNSYPKLLVIYRDITLNDNNAGFIYYLSTLDYKDKLTSSPISYDFYIYETKIKIYQTKFLFPVISTTSYFSIRNIVINNLSTARTSANINFKVYPQRILIEIKYTSFNDILASFGSFFSVFSLLSSLISKIYSGFYFDADLVNGIFKFNTLYENFESKKERNYQNFVLKTEGKLRKLK